MLVAKNLQKDAYKVHLMQMVTPIQMKLQWVWKFTFKFQKFLIQWTIEFLKHRFRKKIKYIFIKYMFS